MTSAPPTAGPKQVRAQNQSLAASQPPIETETQSVLHHQPLTNASGQTVREVWVHWSVQFTGSNPAAGNLALQPNQFIPVWNRANTNSRFAQQRAAMVVSSAAFVMNSRYLVQGGSTQLNSHPKIEAYERGMGFYAGARCELRQPGGMRRTRVPSAPLLAAFDDSAADSFKVSANKFHSLVSSFSLEEHGFPIALVTACPNPIRGALPIQLFNVITGKCETVQQLPLPMIFSDMNESVLTDPVYSEWGEGVLQYYDAFGIKDVGVAFLHGDVPYSGLSTALTPVVFRAKFDESTLGWSGFDHELHERLMPFQQGVFNADLLT